MATERQDELDQPGEAPGCTETPRDGASTDALRDVSRAMVRLYKEQFGRGPEHVSTHTAALTRS
jgi:hypothetical protein